jgi:hypothetical protein
MMKLATAGAISARSMALLTTALLTTALLAMAVATTAHAQSAGTGRFAVYQARDTTLATPVVSLPRTAPSTYSQPLPPLPAQEFRARDITPLDINPLAASPACDAVPHIPAAATPVRPAMVSYRPLVPLVAMPRTYRIGRGILGQPKLYVPGQIVRNAFRYLTP